MRHLLCFLLISYFILSKNKVHIGVAKKSGKVYRIETIGGKNEHSNGGVRSQTDEYGMNYEDDVSWVKYEKDKSLVHTYQFISIFLKILIFMAGTSPL